MKKIIEVNAYAKINLHLEVLDQLPSGYHNIDTVMQQVSLHDIANISFEDGRSSEISLNSTNPYIPCDERNTAYRAAKMILNESGRYGKVNISLKKSIPISAGLGGGSADGAAVLIGLNTLLGEPFGKEKLCQLAAYVGADVPFCVRGGCARAEGVGDILTKCTPLRNCFIVIAKGMQGSRTSEAYSRLSGIKRPAQRKSANRMLAALASGELEKISSELFCAFEQIVLPNNPDASDIKNTLLLKGAKGALMSGSGSSVFGLFDSEQTAQTAAEDLSGKGYFSSVCKPQK